MADTLQLDPRQSGVTVVELMVVVIVISVLAAFALIQPGGANEQFKRQNAAQELKSALERARFDSVKRRADTSAIQARVVVDATSFTLSTDKNQDGTIDSNDEQVTNIAGQNLVIEPEVGTLPVAVTFNQRGEATATDATAVVKSIFRVCNISCSAPTEANSNIVLVTPTGTVNLLPGGSSIPTFSAPANITTVPASNSINNSAAVTPTPTP